jgi:Ca2+-binding RTX toxin-like protein
MSGAITIHGGTGQDTINFGFTVSGTNTLRMSQGFADSVNALLTTDPIITLSPNASGALAPGQSAAPGVYELAAAPGDTLLYNLAANSYVIDSISGGPATLNGGGGDSILVAAINPQVTFNSSGSNNLVIFVDGNNTYNGLNSTGDSVVAGTGFDTINTGFGATTVNSGTGNATITLNDTATSANGTSFNDYVYLDDGHAIVNANGTADAVIATAEGQTIVGGAASGYLGILLASQTTAGNDLVSVTGGATTTVYDSSGNNTIDGGTGVTYVVDGTGTVNYVNAGAGSTYIFGADSSTVVLDSQKPNSGASYFYAGGGNETLSGGMSDSSQYLFGSNQNGASDSLVGGSGTNLLVAGTGSETLVGGAGANTFLLDATATSGANITIGDFLGGTTDTLQLWGFNASDVNNILHNGQNVGGNYVVSLSNGGTLTFDGVTSGSQLSGHIVSF